MALYRLPIDLISPLKPVESGSLDQFCGNEGWTLGALHASLERHGQLVPLGVGVDRESGLLRLLDGRQRFYVLQEQGYDVVNAVDDLAPLRRGFSKLGFEYDNYLVT